MSRREKVVSERVAKRVAELVVKAVTEARATKLVLIDFHDVRRVLLFIQEQNLTPRDIYAQRIVGVDAIVAMATVALTNPYPFQKGVWYSSSTYQTTLTKSWIRVHSAALGIVRRADNAAGVTPAFIRTLSL